MLYTIQHLRLTHSMHFEFMFYFDLETSVYSPQFRQLMGELPGLCEEFSYLGSYQEVV